MFARLGVMPALYLHTWTLNDGTRSLDWFRAAQSFTNLSTVFNNVGLVVVLSNMVSRDLIFSKWSLQTTYYSWELYYNIELTTTETDRCHE